MRPFTTSLFSLAALASLGSGSPITIVKDVKKPAEPTKSPSPDTLALPIDNLVEPQYPEVTPKFVHIVPSLAFDLLPPPPHAYQPIRPSQYLVPPQPQAYFEPAVPAEDMFPDRRGFITGHRIPEEVLRRIEEANSSDRYVDASAFRATVVEVEGPKKEKEEEATTVAPKEVDSETKVTSVPSGVVPEIRAEEPLSSERDVTFYDTRTSFFDY